MTRLLLLIILFGSNSYTQDTLDFSKLNKRMPLDLKEKPIYLNDVTPYTGVAIEYDSAHIVKIIYNFKAGLLSGNQLKYYSTGELKEKTPYINGRRNGASKLYYKSGQINSQMNFRMGHLVDTSKIWYDDSKIKSLSV